MKYACAKSALAQALIAVERFRQANNRLPESLQELVPGYLEILFLLIPTQIMSLLNIR